MSATAAGAATHTTPAPAGAIRNALSLARRNLLHVKTDPEQIIGLTMQPIMFLVLFVYVLGGAISGSSREYLQFALPGILVQSISFTGFSTVLGLNKDFEKGIIDRFRSLPMARSAVVAGRIIGDGVRVIWSTFIIVAFGMIIGFRFHEGVLAGVAGALFVIAFGISVCWPMAVVGIRAKSPESVNTAGFMVILPLTFGSNVFVPTATLPGWLQAFVEVNPVSKVADAARGLLTGGAVAAPTTAALLASAVVVAVFGPLAVTLYRKRT